MCLSKLDFSFLILTMLLVNTLNHRVEVSIGKGGKPVRYP